MKRLLSILSVTFVLCQSAFAQEGRQHKEGVCNPLPSSYQEILRCAEERSPEVQGAQLSLVRSQAEVGKATQWQNPEISAESYHGAENRPNSETEISLSVPIPLGGKLQARRAAAEGSVAQAHASIAQTRASARSQSALKLHRLRQLRHEREVISESVSTFKKLVNQYSSRPRLSPEQELTLAVFRMAGSEYELKLSEVGTELNELNNYFQINLGVSSNELNKVLPGSPKTWPEVEVSGSQGASPRLSLLRAELASALGEQAVARSEMWPTLSVGPSVQLSNEGGRSEQRFGFNVSLPLPIFNLNGPARAAATANVRLTEARLSFLQNEEKNSRANLERTYREIVKVLEQSLSHPEIERRHADTERLFTRGIVPSSLVIEAHRTFVELERTRNERELKALETYFEILTIDGKPEEVNL